VVASLGRLDAYRQRFPSPPDSLTNAILAGTLLSPLGLANPQRRFSADPLERRVELGILPIPRRDVERLHQILVVQPRLMDLRAPYRAQRALLHRHVINEALAWLEVHGGRPEVVQHWRSLRPSPTCDRRGRRVPDPAGPPLRIAAAAAGGAPSHGSAPGIDRRSAAARIMTRDCP
jgi:hypothetical protein